MMPFILSWAYLSVEMKSRSCFSVCGRNIIAVATRPYRGVSRTCVSAMIHKLRMLALQEVLTGHVRQWVSSCHGDQSDTYGNEAFRPELVHLHPCRLNDDKVEVIWTCQA
jgi:hypothetical protein